MRPVMSDQDFSSLLKLIFAEVETAFIVFHSSEELHRLSVSDEAIREAMQGLASGQQPLMLKIGEADNAEQRTTIFIQ